MIIDNQELLEKILILRMDAETETSRTSDAESLGYNFDICWDFKKEFKIWAEKNSIDSIQILQDNLVHPSINVDSQQDALLINLNWG